MVLHCGQYLDDAATACWYTCPQHVHNNYPLSAVLALLLETAATAPSSNSPATGE
jgi:hypothetical protein